MYDTGSGGVLNFLPRAMETHLVLVVLIAVSLVFPWALAAVGLILAYMLFYCAACATTANLDVLRPEHASSTERVKWRVAIGWLHFLEPLARDWGRLKGGLTPWRSALAAEPCQLRHRPWWRGLQPFWRRVKWSNAGDKCLDKNIILERLTRLLSARGCAVGWNSDFEAWDLKLRRGALGEAWLRMVVEHHGGPRGVARFSADVQPSQTILWALAGIAMGAIVTATAGSFLPSAAFSTLLILIWAGCNREINRLECGLQAATEEVCGELVAGSPKSTT